MASNCATIDNRRTATEAMRPCGAMGGGLVATRQNINLLHQRLANLANRVGGPIPADGCNDPRVAQSPIGVAAEMSELAKDTEELLKLVSRLDDLL